MKNSKQRVKELEKELEQEKFNQIMYLGFEDTMNHIEDRGFRELVKLGILIPTNLEYEV